MPTLSISQLRRTCIINFLTTLRPHSGRWGRPEGWHNPLKGKGLTRAAEASWLLRPEGLAAIFPIGCARAL